MKQFTRKLLHLGCAAALPLVTENAAAWSSKTYPLFEPVHQMAIENVLKSQISAANLEILKQQQTVVDQDQQAAQSYEHAMTGIERQGETVAQEKPVYEELTEDFIFKNLTAAIQARKNGAQAAAFTALGKALHPLQDATSPAHELFQTWSYDESFWDQALHIAKERTYPDNAFKARLEAVVQYGYDIFTGKTALPNKFFDADGILLLPANYSKP
jgi:hypothetical protein